MTSPFVNPVCQLSDVTWPDMLRMNEGPFKQSGPPALVGFSRVACQLSLVDLPIAELMCKTREYGSKAFSWIAHKPPCMRVCLYACVFVCVCDKEGAINSSLSRGNYQLGRMPLFSCHECKVSYFRCGQIPESQVLRSSASHKAAL